MSCRNCGGISAIQGTDGGLAPSGINAGCHGNTDGVDANDRAILANVRVFVLCWGQFYDDHPDGLDNAFLLCKDLVTGPFFNGLAQYGVGRGSIVGSGRIVDKNEPATFSEDDLRDKLKDWLRGGFTPPAVNETSLLYVIFPPPGSKPTISNGEDGFCGYHKSTKFNPDSNNNDLFWAMVRTDKSDQTSGATLIKAVSYCVSHEIAEAVTSRDGRGYHKGDCEIGDLCEQNSTFTYRSWKVEQYWSQWDRSCINGDSEISLSRFLQVLGRAGQPLSSLGTPVVNVEYIASQFR